MGRYYRVFAEVKVKDKWVNFNPYIVDLGGHIKLIPLIGYEQSTFREAYDEMSDLIAFKGYPIDMSPELNDYIKPDKIVDWMGKPIKRREVEASTVYTVNYLEAVKKRIVQNKPTKYEGYVDKKIKASHQIGEIQDIDAWLDETQYRELTPQEQIKYSYYEWDDDLSWYHSFKTIEKHIDSMKYWFSEHAHVNGFEWEDLDVSDSDIRLIVCCD